MPPPFALLRPDADKYLTGTSKPFGPSNRLNCSSISVQACSRSASFSRLINSLISPTHFENQPAGKRLQAPLDFRGHTSRDLRALETVCFLNGEQFHKKSRGKDLF